MIKKIVKKAVQIFLILLAACIGLFLIMAVYVVIDDKKQAEEDRVAEKTYTYEQLQKFTDVLNPLGTYFWDEFPELKAKYNLSNEESMILGRWDGFEAWDEWGVTISGCSYEFFPNRLAVANVSGHRFKDNADICLGSLIGTWDIEDNILKMTVFSYFTAGGAARQYIRCNHYSFSIINILDIDPIGYTKKPMALITIPDALKEKLKSKTMRYKSVRMARSLVSYNPLKEGDVSYGYFKYVEEMARENLSGEQIANSPELVYRFFGKPFFL